MRTSELIGPALDWAVALALGETIYMRRDFMKARHAYLESSADLGWHLITQGNDPIIADLATGATKFLPNYSTDWSAGGPIIEGEKIGVGYDRDRVFDSGEAIERWLAAVPFKTLVDHEWNEYGPTPLIAAMRCFVVSKLGDEVEVPQYTL